MFDHLISEITEEMAPFQAQVADRVLVRNALALARQKRLAAANARLRRRQMEGLGEVVASIDSELFWQLVARQGASYKDPDFLRVLLRDNEELRVHCEPDRLTLRVDGLRERSQESATEVDTAPDEITPAEWNETLKPAAA